MAKDSRTDTKRKRLEFGPHKYYAVNLILARWLRHYAVPNQQYCYVTLGGTELRDVANVAWIDRLLASAIVSYENDSERADMARNTAASLVEAGLPVSIVEDDIFCYERDSDLPHIFFVDLTGICKPIPYQKEFRNWLDRDVLRPGDFLLVTSHLGSVKWAQALRYYDAEFRELRSFERAERQRLYYLCHPALVLRRALLSRGLERELRLRPVGSVRYQDRSAMGLYGILVEEGETSLQLLVDEAPFWNTKASAWQ